MISKMGSTLTALRSLADAAHLQAVKDALNNAAQQAQNTQNELQKVADSISDASKKITDGTASADDTRKSLKKQIAAAKQSITDMANTYDTTIKPQLDELGKSMSDVVKQSGSVIDGLAATATSMSGLSGDITGSLSDVQSSLGDAATTLNASAEKLDSLNKQLTAVVGGSGIPDLSQITSADPDSIATLLSAPVSVNRIALYPVANYGSAMTPFYTVLSIWVGAMLDVLRKPRPESPGNARRFGLHPYQEYFGRYAIFGAMALLQGTLVCLGDMFFLGVQCEHPLQFLMVGWLCALVFSLLIYTLTVSFGDIGKAIAVVLLVMQVAGSGGTFPIETLPPFFQTICKWLLFPYGVDAMHSAMAGSFGNEYWVSMGKLALFILPALLLGLVLRKPVMRLNDWIIRNLESTKVM